MPELSLSEMLDIASKIAYSAKMSGKDYKSQINRILEVLEVTSDERELKAPVLTTIAFVIRQMGRNEIDNKTGALIKDALFKLIDTDKPKDHARKLLGLFKWLYESIEKRRLPRVSTIDQVNFKWITDVVCGTR